VPLRAAGVWSYTNNCYAPPPPSWPPILQPYAVAAVELEKERMVVLGQVEAGVGVGPARVGHEMELTRDALRGSQREVVIWKWRPLAAEGRA
jgi:uncharacterized OB-fold protein